ncbi:MAG: hypothetical protein AB8B77_00915 [Alphaproteobacteria bacterium]
MPNKLSPGAPLPFMSNVKNRLDLASFVEAPANRLALTHLGAWQQWHSPATLLIGDGASGKTHLAHIWQELLLPHDLSPLWAEGANINAEFLEKHFRQYPYIIVENADNADPSSLMALYNDVQEQMGAILLTSRLPLAQWPHLIPELTSRLRAASTQAIDTPDDALIGDIMIKLFHDRQLSLPQTTIDFFVKRIERSYESMLLLVEQFDHYALAQAKPLNRKLARDFLDDFLDDFVNELERL